eukprot:g31822.t1
MAHFREGNYSGFCEALAVGGCQDAAISVTLAQPQEFDCPLIGVSKGFQTLSGYLKHEVLGRNCRFLNRGCAIPQEDRLKLRASARTGKSFSGLLQNRKKNGEVFLNLVCINSLRVGSTFYLLGIQVDMTHSSGDRKGDVQEVVRRQLDTIVKTIMEVQQDALSRLQVPFNLSWLQAEGKDPSSFVALETQSPAVLTKNTFLEVEEEDEGSLRRAASDSMLQGMTIDSESGKILKDHTELELCSGGELFDRIVADGKFTEQVAAFCVQQMLRAVNYMHINGIMHRDLKPENWLLAETDAWRNTLLEVEAIEKTYLKLIDFGLSKRFSPGDFAKTKAGTPYYVAPEVLSGRYNELSDVWSIGVIMYILLSGSPPFSGADTMAVLDSVRQADLSFDQKEWSAISKEAMDMLKVLLMKDPSQRVTADSALKEAWLTKQHASHDLTQASQAVVQNLKSFAVMNKLKKAALNVIATQLTDDAIKDLKEFRLFSSRAWCYFFMIKAESKQCEELFMAMDDNNDGTLSVAELKEGLTKAGVAVPADLAAMMERIDTDGSGVIDYSEFMAATLDKRHFSAWQLSQELMKLLGGNTLVSDVMQIKYTAKEVDAIMKEVDLNGDGRIDFEEFMTMMRKMPKDRKAIIGIGLQPSKAAKQV